MSALPLGGSVGSAASSGQRAALTPPAAFHIRASAAVLRDIAVNLCVFTAATRFCSYVSWVRSATQGLDPITLCLMFLYPVKKGRCLTVRAASHTHSHWGRLLMKVDHTLL